ncbi:MAG: FkbM family methyltransferase [Gluconacetobacter diazotrophicus]|nr:FkbM family methyltransferase [Gluconacetobacter diazotrophicus]
MTTTKQLLKRGVQTLLSPRLAARPAAREFFFLVAREFTPSLVADIGPIRYHVSTADRTVGREVFLTGGYDDSALARVLRLLRGFGGGVFGAKTFVDIGANIGTSTLPAVLRHGFARAVAVEPDETNHTLLTQSVVANGLEQRVKTIRAALSDEEKEVLLERCPVNHGDHRVRSGDLLPTAAPGAREAVPVFATTFDALVRRGLIPLDEVGLVWIDTEGHEGHVFRGARSLLASDIPVVVKFRPQALERAHGLEWFEHLAQTHYPWMVDTRAADADKPVLLPTAQLGALRGGYRDGAKTDLLLLKSRP